MNTLALAGEAPQRKRDSLGSPGEFSGQNEEDQVGPTAGELVGLIIVVGTAAITIVKVAHLWTSRSQSPSADVTARVDALESSVERLQQEQAETLERLDFAERLLSKAREERRISS